MSSAQAIAAVSATLVDRLTEWLTSHGVASIVANLTVTSIAPDLITTGQNADPQLNLFLYHVTPNPGWRNAALPSRNGNGDRLTNPPLAIDLHYLLTAYASQPLHAELALGFGMQLLHELPVLPRDAIRQALQKLAGPPQSGPNLVTSELADQIEQIKISPETLNTEEISKLWTALQKPYRPTAAYMVSVVLIEEKQGVRAPLPVQARNISVAPLRPPVIDRALPDVITMADKLTLAGHDLDADPVQVEIDGALVKPDSHADAQVVVTLPSGILAGVHGVQVVHQVVFGIPGKPAAVNPADPHAGTSSNLVPFVLHPRVTNASAAGGQVTVKMTPQVGPNQRVTLLLNQRKDTQPASLTFIGPARPALTDTLVFTVGAPPAGSYFVRVQVDGAGSPLDMDQSSPTFGPVVTI